MVEKILAQVHLLLGWQAGSNVPSPEKESILQFIFDLVVTEVKNYCHITEIPVELYQVLSMMIVDVFRQSDLGKEVVSRDPASIKRGDVTVSYKVPFERSNDSMRNSTYMVHNAAFMKDYYKQLNAFRQVAR